jgi:hypothetical protein
MPAVLLCYSDFNLVPKALALARLIAAVWLGEAESASLENFRSHSPHPAEQKRF